MGLSGLCIASYNCIRIYDYLKFFLNVNMEQKDIQSKCKKIQPKTAM